MSDLDRAIEAAAEALRGDWDRCIDLKTLATLAVEAAVPHLNYPHACDKAYADLIQRAEKAEMTLVVLRARGHDLYLAEQKRAVKAEALADRLAEALRKMFLFDPASKDIEEADHVLGAHMEARRVSE